MLNLKYSACVNANASFDAGGESESWPTAVEAEMQHASAVCSDPAMSMHVII